MLKLLQFKKIRITTKFIFWFLLIALVPLAIATSITYSRSQTFLEEEVVNRLRAVADNKINQVEGYLREKKRDITSLSRMSVLTLAAERFDDTFKESGISSSEYRAIEREYLPVLAYYQKEFGCDDLLLISSEGNLLFSVTQEYEFTSLYKKLLYKDSELTGVFNRASSSLKTEVSGFRHYPLVDSVSVFIASPVIKAGKVIATVVASMSNQAIYHLVSDYAGLGATGEVAIAAKIGKDAVFITPLRFDDAAAFKKKIKIGAEESIAVQNAVMRKQGSGVLSDYRGKDVLAIWDYLPSFQLGVVVKMDTVEIFSSARKMRNTLLFMSLVLAAVVVIAAIVIAHSVSGPIKELTNISGVITGGNLSERADIKTQDEIGELAHSFNKMTDSLVDAKSIVEQERFKLEEQKHLLEKVNKELDSFVYTVSHDLRAPLRAISSFSTFLEEDYSDKIDAEGKDHLQEIRKGADRMSTLIDDLLALSRISRVSNPYEEVSINDLVNSVIERIRFDIDAHKVSVVVQPDMPKVFCDRIKMGEAFLNLINNAIKFSTKNNTQKPSINIGYVDKGDSYEFYVKDNGIGIDPQYHEDIFGIFKRLHNTSEYEGTGAGLSIVKRIIDDHSGYIRIDSELGKGATFYFTIPKGLHKKKKIGEILVAEGLVSQDDLDSQLRKQKQ